VGAVNRIATDRDLALTAAGGMPGELLMNWKAKGIGTFDCEFGFSCMGYEIAGGWGAAMADPSRDTFVMVGDGSYLLMNSDIYSSVLSGHKLIVVVCDNGGFLVIDRLQRAKGIPSFNNSLDTCRTAGGAFRVDFAKHAEAMGAIGVKVKSIGDLEDAVRQAKAADRTTVIHIEIHPTDWTGNDNSWWECGTPEVSEREAVNAARADHVAGKKKQRVGV
jgi:3D-(3,5/4)-trihydroxycyclohexane-1,2-dione acylhydrolase (decyclizing)